MSFCRYLTCVSCIFLRFFQGVLDCAFLGWHFAIFLGTLLTLFFKITPTNQPKPTQLFRLRFHHRVVSFVSGFPETAPKWWQSWCWRNKERSHPRRSELGNKGWRLSQSGGSTKHNCNETKSQLIWMVIYQERWEFEFGISLYIEIWVAQMGKWRVYWLGSPRVCRWRGLNSAEQIPGKTWKIKIVNTTWNHWKC